MMVGNGLTQCLHRAGQEPRSPTRPRMMATSPRSPTRFKLPHTNPRTTSNGSAVHFIPLNRVSSFTPAPAPTPKPCCPKDLIPPSSPAPKLPCTPPSSPPMDLIPPSPPSSLSPEPSSPPGISILERLIKTCPVWLQLGMSPERAALILYRETPGIFLVRKNPVLKKMILSVRFCDQEGEPQVQDLLIREEKSLVYLEGSVLVFDDIFKLIAFYCVSRDILPFKLRLPQVIIQATKHEDMEMMSSLGSEFWGSSLNRCAEDRKSCSGPAGQVPQAVAHGSRDLSETEPSAGGDRLWYVNPIFIEEHCSSLPIVRSQSLTTPGPAVLRYKRPAPLPPRPHALEEHPLLAIVPQCAPSQVEKKEEKEGSRGEASTPELLLPCSPHTATSQPSGQRRIPPVPPRRKPSEKQLLEEQEEEENVLLKEDEKPALVPVATLVSIDDASTTETLSTGDKVPTLTTSVPLARLTSDSESTVAPTAGKAAKPVPPPRRKRQTLLTKMVLTSPVSGDPSSNLAILEGSRGPPQTSSTPTPTRRSASGTDLQGSDMSLYSPEGGPSQLDPDSYSTSSTEEDPDPNSSNMATIKRSSTIMLDKAKQRLSMVNLSHIFTSFMSADKKLKKRIVELALDRESYFGNLVRDYRTYTLETMQKHSSSTEMLQEIRLMMTQLKSYLIQSAELKSLLEPLVPPEERLEAIIEAALCKSVLKPLREAIYSRLRDIHTQDGSLDRVRDNQQVVLNTTTTDLGVTTSVPEAPAMEKIQLKLSSLYKEYSPEQKISFLLKTCKIIYESMSVSSPGKPYGADDFLPVLMYVLARCNMATLLLDVEYMMELMDPALQLGEGSYYLTTTYGALEHIKNYDKLEVTGQFSIEIQDSIHRWERRRTLNKARVSRNSVQDFINVSFLEAGSNTKTLGARPGTTALDLCTQCAKKFEVLEPECYGLFVLVEGCYRALAPDELPLSVKSSLHHSEPRKEYYFVYRPGGMGKEAVPPKPDTPPDSLI
ncbi:ras and Rab interactor 3-like [Scleropages formosus]|uniref:Ras and Rab interactor 3-like n=1 Tax=Scleropages formosus TaxID=113540 RepID=A0A0P7UGB8_SCLFO|nr:ras and Rab interactor 3-like [Scleropages formosus]